MLSEYASSNFMTGFIAAVSALAYIFYAGKAEAYDSAISGAEPDPPLELFLEYADYDEFESQEAMEAYLEDLSEIFPLDVNRAAIEKLLMIPGIPERIVHMIDEHRSHNHISSIEDLQEIRGIGTAKVASLRPWLSAGHKRSGLHSVRQDVTVRQMFRFQQVLEKASGYSAQDGTEPHYLGPPFRLQHRQQVSGSRVAANLTQVKLPGEPFEAPAGFDFTSANISISDTGPVSRFVLGDYSARFGQGLVMWSSASFGKGGVSHTAPYRRAHGIMPYGSSGQAGFLRGVAAETRLPVPFVTRSPINSSGNRTKSGDPALVISGFHSSRNRTAVELQGDTIRPPSQSPFHRTENELSRKNNTKEFVTGGNISVRSQRWSAGVTYASFRLNRPVVPASGSSPFRGRDTRNISSDIVVTHNRFRLFAEYALKLSESGDDASGYSQALHPFSTGSSVNGNSTTGNSTTGNTASRNAWIAGISGTIGISDWILSLRNYGPGYWSESGSAFGEGSAPPGNQSGWYAGFRVRPHSRFHIHGFLDRFHFPAPVRSNIRPSAGYEPMIALQYRPSTGMSINVRLRYKKRDTEAEVQDDYLRNIRISSYDTRLAGRFQIDWHVTGSLFLRSQYDMVRTGGLHQETNNGMSLTKVIRTAFRKRWRVDMGLTAFQTTGFSSRLHVYQHDLTHSMASGMVYGTGRRSYLVVRYRPFDSILAEIKYSRTHHFDRAHVGTGHDMTAGPVRSAAGVQLIFQY